MVWFKGHLFCWASTTWISCDTWWTKGDGKWATWWSSVSTSYVSWGTSFCICQYWQHVSTRWVSTWLSEILTLNLLSILICLCMYIFRLPEPAWFTFVIYICHLNANELVPCFTGVDTLSLSHPIEYSVGCS